MVDLRIKIGELKLKNPVMVASGAFGYAEEFKDFMNLKELGAIVTKTITLKPRQGNPAPRTCETPAGMLNSIGLENPGLEVFIREKLPLLLKIGPPIIVSIASESGPEEFVELARKVDKIKEIAAIELNISCPNIRGKPLLISQDPKATYGVVRGVRRVTSKTLITKLSPNVTFIADIAKATEAAGTDAVSLINTITAMSIDVKTRKPKIASLTGGLSGPAIRPVAVRMVWEVNQKIKIPIIGMGGIMDTPSAVEFIIAGATAISVGTANFINPRVSIEIIKGIKKYLQENNINSINELIGSIRC
ncbi:MAG: dihydroorotate dehydrogenase B catalytic subunit [Candidatus Omnitrophica bacterium CG23_combo_of_CG06-09_8_20_14_all_40_11]|nr:MAG: dihydroorotate dehydrogenase B catalytic subunit [Candidatus Omnitrophica bacterium CG23_combo_of_CG06-09_8_20_14_all_40_11]